MLARAQSVGRDLQRVTVLGMNGFGGFLKKGNHGMDGFSWGHSTSFPARNQQDKVGTCRKSLAGVSHLNFQSVTILPFGNKWLFNWSLKLTNG